VEASILITKIAGWARRDSRVAAAAVCGSHARGEAGPDSDIDFCILAMDPRSLLEDFSWITALGNNARIVEPVEDYKLVQSIRVFYGSTEAEFGVTDKTWATLPLDAETARVIYDGLRILYDPEGSLSAAVEYAAQVIQSAQ
jgi:predicted nucleotidyltransferase